MLEELELVKDEAQERNTTATSKSLSESFLSSGRLDAEYYQPKYDYLLHWLSTKQSCRLGEMVNIQKSVEPGSDAYQSEGIPFVRVADLSKQGLSEPSIFLNRKQYECVLRPNKDTILLSKDGSVGIAYKVDEPLDVITSGAILHLSVKTSQVLPDYLTLVLNSIVVRMQAERDAGGSIIQHWKPSEIEKVVIPILPMEEQSKLSQMLQESFSLRKQSLQLLEQAKATVEQAIEQC